MGKYEEDRQLRWVSWMDTLYSNVHAFPLDFFSRITELSNYIPNIVVYFVHYAEFKA